MVWANKVFAQIIFLGENNETNMLNLKGLANENEICFCSNWYLVKILRFTSIKGFYTFLPFSGSLLRYANKTLSIYLFLL